MRRQLVAATRMLLVLTVALGVLYPLSITLIAWVTMRDRAEGSLVVVDGRVVGSSLIGQVFEGDRWFHPRPGIYDPTASGPSNLGPGNPEFIHAVRARQEVLGGSGAPVPADAVMGSGSGLDPDISPAFAQLQVPRVASARGLAPDVVRTLVQEHVTGRTFGVLGEPRVNVLALNLALEQLASGP
jgi:K+-transporting ATPase ATPase C chain